MKKITLYTLGIWHVFLVSMYSFAQTNKKKDMGFIIPIFIDSTKFIKELTINKNVGVLYQKYKKNHDYISYKYDFNISPWGKVVPGIYGEEASLNEFIKNRFNKYKWKAASRNGEKKTGYGSMEINLIPSKNIMQIEINMSDGSTDKQTNIKIIMDKTIAM